MPSTGGNGSLLVAKSVQVGAVPFSPRVHRDQPEGQAQLVCEVRPQEIRQIRAVGANHDALLVFCGPGVVEEEVVRRIAQDVARAFQLVWLTWLSSGASNMDSIHAE